MSLIQTGICNYIPGLLWIKGNRDNGMGHYKNPKFYQNNKIENGLLSQDNKGQYKIFEAFNKIQKNY